MAPLHHTGCCTNVQKSQSESHPSKEEGGFGGLDEAVAILKREGVGSFLVTVFAATVTALTASEDSI